MSLVIYVVIDTSVTLYSLAIETETSSSTQNMPAERQLPTHNLVASLDDEI